MRIRISVHAHINCGYIIGSHGTTIKNIIERTGTTIDSPKLPGDTMFLIDGDKQNVLNAAKHILDLANVFARKEKLQAVDTEHIIAQALSASGDGGPVQQQYDIQGGPPAQQQAMPPQQQYDIQGGPPAQQQVMPPLQQFGQPVVSAAQQVVLGGMMPSDRAQWTAVPSQPQMTHSSALSTPLHIDVSRSSAPHTGSSSGPTSSQHRLAGVASYSGQQTVQSAVHGTSPSKSQVPPRSIQMRRNDGTGLYYDFLRSSANSPKYRCVCCLASYDAEIRVSRGMETFSIIDPGKNHSRTDCEFQEEEQRSATKRPSATGATSEAGPSASKTLRMNSDCHEKAAISGIGNRYSDNCSGAYVVDSGNESLDVAIGGARSDHAPGGTEQRRTFIGVAQGFTDPSRKADLDEDTGQAVVTHHHSQSGNGAQSGGGIIQHDSDGGSLGSASAPGGFELEHQVAITGEHGELKWTVTNVVRESTQIRYINMVLPGGRQYYGFHQQRRNSTDIRCRKCKRALGPACNAEERAFHGKNVWIVENPAQNHRYCIIDIDKRNPTGVFGSAHGGGLETRTQNVRTDDDCQVVYATGSGTSAGAQRIDRRADEQPIHTPGSGRRSSSDVLGALLPVQRAFQVGDLKANSFSEEQKRRMTVYAKAIMEESER